MPLGPLVMLLQLCSVLKDQEVRGDEAGAVAAGFCRPYPLLIYKLTFKGVCNGKYGQRLEGRRRGNFQVSLLFFPASGGDSTVVITPAPDPCHGQH